MSRLGLLAIASVAIGCSFSGGESVAGDGSSDAAPQGDGNGEVDAPDASPPSMFCASSSPEVVACYDFEGNFDDGTGRHHGVPDGPTANFVATSGGMGVVLTGAESAIVADATDFDVDALTIEAWVSIAARPMDNEERVIWDTDGQYALFINDDDIEVGCQKAGDTPLRFEPGSPFLLNQFYYLVCTISSTEMRLFIDGELVATRLISSSIVHTPTRGNSIGANLSNGQVDSQFVGTFDAVRVMSTARDPAAIALESGP